MDALGFLAVVILASIIAACVGIVLAIWGDWGTGLKILATAVVVGITAFGLFWIGVTEPKKNG